MDAFFQLLTESLFTIVPAVLLCYSNTRRPLPFATKCIYSAVVAMSIVGLFYPSLVNMRFASCSNLTVFGLELWRIFTSPFINNNQLSSLVAQGCNAKLENEKGTIVAILLNITMMVATAFAHLTLCMLPLLWGDSARLWEGLVGIIPTIVAMVTLTDRDNHMFDISQMTIEDVIKVLLVVQNNRMSSGLAFVVGTLFKNINYEGYLVKTVRRWENNTNNNRLLLWLGSCDGFVSIHESLDYGMNLP